MLLEKNQHLAAASSLLGNKSKAKALLQSLSERPEGSFQFIGTNHPNEPYTLLILNNAGATATLLAKPPKNEDEIEPIGRLIREGLGELPQSNATLAQTVMGLREPLLKQAFLNAGFSKLATLTFMEQTRPPKKISTQHAISYKKLSSNQDQLLGYLLEETYIDSLDCPKIHGVRKTQDIIDGHRGYDSKCTQVWFIAELESKPAGVILLNAIPKTSSMELAYIGISPWARGRGLGHTLMQHITEQAISQDFSRITLAVDAANIPALGLYKKWNFIEKNKRDTFIHKLSTVC